MALATAATAEPKSTDECLKQAIDLAESAEAKNLSDDKLAKIEDLLTKMEGHCEGSKFADAATVAKDIQGAIDAK